MHPVYFVNAFTADYYKGNTAAVVMLDSYPTATSMLALAKEFGFSETVFLCPKAKDRYQIRWFTPEVEVALCGHGTLAAAKVLISTSIVKVQEIHFDSLSGMLLAKKQGEKIELDFPADVPTSYSVNSEVITALGKTAPEEVLYAAGTKNLVVVYPEMETVLNILPDFAKLISMEGNCFFGIAVTAKSEQANSYICRYFAPWEGINEDPVTGSAQTYLAPYWANRLGVKTLQGIQASDRGGAFEVEVNESRVLIRGEAFIYLSGEISSGWQ